MFQKILFFIIALSIGGAMGVQISLPLIIFFALIYTANHFAWRHFRDTAFDALAKKLSFDRIDESTVGPLITSGKINLFRNSECIARRAIGGEQNKVKALLADLVISTETGLKSGNRYGRQRNSPINFTSVASCCVIIDPSMNLPISSIYDETVWEKLLLLSAGKI